MSGPILVTDRDKARLSEIVELFSTKRYDVLVEFLRRELGRAKVIAPERVPRHVATMHSRVRYRDDTTGDVLAATLVYPGEEDDLLGRISILSSLGTALLGLSEGQSIAWTSLDGRRRRVTLLEVVYQPEAAGRFES
ncbi:MAG TPA: nucleoside diphosphate kinase regulator [Alphaproteobacteria bacterium]